MQKLLLITAIVLLPACLPACLPLLLPQVSRSRAGSNGSSGSSSRSRVLINGVGSSLRVVRALADVLVDVNGQAASLALRDSGQQLAMLDRIAGQLGCRWWGRGAGGGGWYLVCGSRLWGAWHEGLADLLVNVNGCITGSMGLRAAPGYAGPGCRWVGVCVEGGGAHEGAGGTLFVEVGWGGGC